MSRIRRVSGFTLIEMLLGASIMSIVLIALIGAYLGQGALNTHARNLTLAMNDATRVMEAIRQQNVGATCTARGYPTAIPTYLLLGVVDSTPTWNEWLEATVANQGGGGKSIGPTPAHEQVVVTCRDGADTSYCGTNQMRGGFTQVEAVVLPAYDPIQITVAIGWREGRRVLGTNSDGQSEFTFSLAWWLQPQTALRRLAYWFDRSLAPSAEASGGGNSGGGSTPPPSPWIGLDANSNGVIDSQAMLTTLITCR